MTDPWPAHRPSTTDPLALATPQDRERAEETIPRGRSSEDDSRRPAVDEDIWLLHVLLRRTGDRTVLAALVEEYQAFALSLARRLHRDREPLDDLRQVALESLVASLRRFDPGFGVPFVGFATPTIVGALKRHYRDQGWAMRVPRSAHDLAAPAREAADRIAAEKGRAATTAEVAEALGITEEDLLIARSAERARSLVSLDAPRPGDDDRVGIEVGVVDAGFLLAEGRASLERALPTLSHRDRTILQLSFFEGESQKKIAERYGVSQMQVSRWMTSAIGRLRSRMAVTVPADPVDESAAV
ncbi:MAG TPA: sigma-70 family RNA polymerase sigma factor [Iamia sp.]|nr:sigma-70 family RNA polymerase sigma factor [Iamia sp.]